MPGEELTFDYGDASGEADPLGGKNEKNTGISGNRTRCMCGTPTCREYMPYDETL